MNVSIAGDRGHARLQLSLVAILLVAGFSLRFYDLTGQSLWYDEGVSLEFSEGDSISNVLEHLGTTRTSERYQPLYFVLLHVWRQVFGSSEWALRSLSAVLGTLALTVFIPATRGFLQGSQRLAAIGFLALSSFAVYYSQEVRPYGLLLLLCILHWLLISKLCVPGATVRSRSLLLPAAAVSLVGGLTSLFFSFHIASAGCAWLLTRDKRSREWRFWIVSALALIPSLTFFAIAGSDGGGDSAVVSRTERSILANAAFSLYGLLVGTTFGPPVAELRFGLWGVALQQNWPSLLVFGLVCVGLAFAAVLALNSNRADATGGLRRHLAFLLTALGIGALVLFVFAFVTKLNWLPRHSTFLIPALALATGGLIPVGYRESGVRNRVRVWSVVALLALNLLSLQHYFHNEAHRRGDYRGVAAFLRKQQPTPVVLLLGSPSLLEYYGAPDLLDIRWKPVSRKRAVVEQYTRASDSFLVVINREDLLPGGLDGANALFNGFSTPKRSKIFRAFRVMELRNHTGHAESSEPRE